MQCHYLCHICAEIEQVGCGYSEAFLGQNLEPFYQRDKAAGLVTYDDAVFMFKNLIIKLNEIDYYYGEAVAKQNSSDLGQSITLAGYTEDGEDATAEMDYVILDACGYLALPQPPLSCALTNIRLASSSRRFSIPSTPVSACPVRERRGDVQAGPASLGPQRQGRRPPGGESPAHLCRGLRGQLHPLRDRPSGGGQPNLGKVIELTMNNGFDPRTKKQIGPKTGNPESFKNFEELYAAFEKQLQFCEDTLRRGAWIASMLNADSSLSPGAPS